MHAASSVFLHKGGRGGSLYDLYAVVHHLGALSSGHYVASVKSQPSGKWHYFNDDQVDCSLALALDLASSAVAPWLLFMSTLWYKRCYSVV